MAEQLKAIVAGLKCAPFNKQYNVISFDALDGLQLLQVLSDALCNLDEKPSIDLRNEPAEATAVRLINALRIIRFKEPVDPDEQSAFRASLIQGDKPPVYAVLQWIVEHVDETKQRMYLSRYLMPVEVPSEFQTDADVQQLQQQCHELMQRFKEVHSESTLAQQDSAVLDDIKTDMRSMDVEREQLARRIDKAKRKVENVRAKDEMLKLAGELRLKVEREHELAAQKADQRNTLLRAEQKIQRLQQQIRELRQEADTLRPEDMMKKMEEENQIYTYLLTDKLPKELEVKRKVVQDMTKVLSQPAMDSSDIDDLKNQVAALQEHIAGLTAERDRTTGAGDEKLAIYRQQAGVVEKKKSAVAERLQRARAELLAAESEVAERKRMTRDADGNEIVTSVQFKNYVNKLRTKTNDYKKKRADLQDLRAEIGVLARTEEILRHQLAQLRDSIESSGQEFVEVRPEQVRDQLHPSAQRPKTAKPHSKDVLQLKDMVADLERQLERNNDELAPLLARLKPIRAEYEELAARYARGKRQYDTTAAGLESALVTLDTTVREMRADDNSAQSTVFKLSLEKRQLDALLDRCQNRQEEVMDGLKAALDAAERAGVELRQAHATTAGADDRAAESVRQFRDLLKIMQCKHRLAIGEEPPA